MAAKIDLRKPAATQPQPFAVPPAASPTGVAGQMPIGVGQVVPKTLTPAEKAVFDSLKIKPGQAVPGNLAQQVQYAKDAAQADIVNAPPPLPLNTPPLKLPEVVPLSQLPAEHQKSIEQSLKDTAEHYKMQQAVAASTLDPSVQAAIKVGMASQQPKIEDTEIVDDRNSAVYADTGEAKKLAKVESEPVSEMPHLPTYCPHCGWDQEVQDTTPVTVEDKRGFLAALLGGKPWKRAYLVIGGSLEIVCRSLTGPEVDLCFKQAYLESKRGELPGHSEFAEQVNRYRVMLQLVSIRSTTGMTHVLPESVNDWGVDKDPDNTPLSAIKDYFYSNVLTTEMLHRVAGSTVMQFNRLLGKMEANVENSDFWTGTVPQA